MRTTLTSKGATTASIVAAIGILFVAASSSAALLPDPVLTTPCGTASSGTLICGPGFGPTTVLSQASLVLGPSVEQTIQTTNATSFQPNETRAKYWFELQSSNGFASGELVPLLITAIGFTETSGFGPTQNNAAGFNANTAEASVLFGNVSIAEACTDLAQPSFCGNRPTSFNKTTTLSVNPNLVTQFLMQLVAQTGLNSSYLTSSAHAFADPYVQIDPDFLLTHPTYSLAFGPGVANAVPAPASVLLLGTGLAGLGGRRWLRRKISS